MESENKKVKLDLVEQIKKAIINEDEDYFANSFDKIKIESENLVSLKDFVFERDDPYSNLMKGVIYLSGNGGFKKNIIKALDCFYESSKNENVNSYFYLGYLYDSFDKIKNYELSIKYYKKAIQKGCVASIYIMGIMYQRGHGVDKNYKKALEYFKLAISKNFFEYAYHAIGDLYEYGRGVPRNLIKAVKYYLKGANKGCEEAQKSLENIKNNGMEDIIKLVIENQRLKKENIHLSLRPPNVGGAEYIAAKKRFEDTTGSNSE